MSKEENPRSIQLRITRNNHPETISLSLRTTISLLIRAKTNNNKKTLIPRAKTLFLNKSTKKEELASKCPNLWRRR